MAMVNRLLWGSRTEDGNAKRRPLFDRSGVNSKQCDALSMKDCETLLAQQEQSRFHRDREFGEKLGMSFSVSSTLPASAFALHRFLHENVLSSRCTSRQEVRTTCEQSQFSLLGGSVRIETLQYLAVCHSLRPKTEVDVISGVRGCASISCLQCDTQLPTRGDNNIFSTVAA
jgi:hypothetical protein